MTAMSASRRQALVWARAMRRYRGVLLSVAAITVLWVPWPAGAQRCTGDCNGDGAVSIDELVRGVRGALGTLPVSACPFFDANDDGTVTVDELVSAVEDALSGCAGGPVLTVVDRQVDGVDGVQDVGDGQSIAISPDGLHVYLDADAHSAIAVFRRDPQSGALTFVQAYLGGCRSMEFCTMFRSLVVSPDGANLYGVGPRTDVVFGLDPDTGVLSVLQALSDGETNSSTFAAISPDGADLYTNAAFLRRDAESGLLTFGDAVPVSGNAVAVSPDGRNVYVASTRSHRLFNLARDASTGETMLLQEFVDGVGGVDGLTGPEAVVVSPESTHVYVASAHAGTIALFEHDPAGGTLRFVSVTPGVPSAFHIAISPDGAYVFAQRTRLSVHRDQVVAFRRDRVTGALMFREAVDNVAVMAVSPDSRHLYAAGPHALTAFRINREAQ